MCYCALSFSLSCVCAPKGLASYTYDELVTATDNRSPVMKLGHGGFGEVENFDTHLWLLRTVR